MRPPDSDLGCWTRSFKTVNWTQYSSSSFLLATCLPISLPLTMFQVFQEPPPQSCVYILFHCQSSCMTSLWLQYARFHYPSKTNSTKESPCWEANSPPNQMRTALFWDITQRVVVIPYRLKYNHNNRNVQPRERNSNNTNRPIHTINTNRSSPQH